MGLQNELDMNFNYVPILFGEVKEGVGEKPSAIVEKLLSIATPTDKRLADIIIRQGGKESRFNEKIAQDGMVCQTLTSHGFYRGADKRKLSTMDYYHVSTFPEDYDFCGQNVAYICGMSVPPIMIKRIVTRLIESGVFEK
jgi:DNA (cytosine-5)-methyltransferase 1